MTRRVLVTGGASGIGQVVVELLVAAGDHVVVADLSAERLGDLSRRLPGIVPVAVDLSTPEGVDEAIAAAPDGVDVLVANAGISDLHWADDTTPERWNAVIAANLTAPFLLTRAVVPSMVERGGGAIVYTGSVASIRGGRSGIAYTASKSGLLGMCRNVASTYGPAGVRANLVAPGPVRTRIGESVDERPDRAIEALRADPRKPAHLEPEGVAEVIVFLASRAARHVNGVAIAVDDGWTAF